MTNRTRPHPSGKHRAKNWLKSLEVTGNLKEPKVCRLVPTSHCFDTDSVVKCRFCVIFSPPLSRSSALRLCTAPVEFLKVQTTSFQLHETDQDNNSAFIEWNNSKIIPIGFPVLALPSLDIPSSWHFLRRHAEQFNPFCCSSIMQFPPLSHLYGEVRWRHRRKNACSNRKNY